jgi:hypothetical protein
MLAAKSRTIQMECRSVWEIRAKKYPASGLRGRRSCGEVKVLEMKHVFLIAIVVAVIAAPAKGADTAAQLNAQELARVQSGGIAPMAPPPVAATAPRSASTAGCPPGTKWVPAGYIRKGKYREAGCRSR